MHRSGLLVLGCTVLLGLVLVPGYAGADDVTADRTLNATTVSPGETVTVTGAVTIGSETSVDYADEFDPAFESVTLRSIERGDDEVTPTIQSVAGDGVVLVLDDVGPGTVTAVYEVTVPDDAAAGTTYTFDGLVQVDGEPFEIEGEDSLTVEAAGAASFDVTIDDADETVTAGDETSVAYTVENTGEATGTQDLTVSVDGEVIETTSLALAPGETVSETVSYTTAPADSPEIEFEVASEDDTATAVVTVNAADDANDSDDGFGPGFGVAAVALGVLSVAALAFARRGPR